MIEEYQNHSIGAIPAGAIIEITSRRGITQTLQVLPLEANQPLGRIECYSRTHHVSVFIGYGEACFRGPFRLLSLDEVVWATQLSDVNKQLYKNQLAAFTRGDGSHRGLSDWYLRGELALVVALMQPQESTWTTGWYGSKHEIASACIANQGDGSLRIEASVSDDFDTPGCGQDSIPFTRDLSVIRKAIDRSHDAADKDRKGNEPYLGFKILTDVESYGLTIGGVGQGDPVTRPGWVETYILQKPVDWPTEEPPGDCYHQWGFQGEYEIPEETKTKLEDWIRDRDTTSGDGAKSFTVDGFTVEPFSE